MATGPLCHGQRAGLLDLLGSEGPAGYPVDRRGSAGVCSGGPAAAVGKGGTAAALLRRADRGRLRRDLPNLAGGGYCHRHLSAAGGACLWLCVDGAADSCPAGADRPLGGGRDRDPGPGADRAVDLFESGYFCRGSDGGKSSLSGGGHSGSGPGPGPDHPGAHDGGAVSGSLAAPAAETAQRLCSHTSGRRVPCDDEPVWADGPSAPAAAAAGRRGGSGAAKPQTGGPPPWRDRLCPGTSGDGRRCHAAVRATFAGL